MSIFYDSMPTADEELMLDFTGLHYMMSWFRIRVYRPEGESPVIVATSPYDIDDSGTPSTNGRELVFLAAWVRVGKPLPAVFVEHKLGNADQSSQETWAIVTFAAHDDKPASETIITETASTFRDPYFLDFLGLADTYSERDLEAAIIKEIERFMLEMGEGFAFVARQKRISTGSKDYYIDLLFYHRGLKRLVAIDLKLGAFEPQYKGQMELYLRWLDKYDRQPGEDAPIGLILCSEKDREEIELLQLDSGDIRVAEYLTPVATAGGFKTKAARGNKSSTSGTTDRRIDSKHCRITDATIENRCTYAKHFTK